MYWKLIFGLVQIFCKIQGVVYFIRFSPWGLITSCIAGNSCNLIEQVMVLIGMFGFFSCVNFKAYTRIFFVEIG